MSTCSSVLRAFCWSSIAPAACRRSRRRWCPTAVRYRTVRRTTDAGRRPAAGKTDRRKGRARGAAGDRGIAAYARLPVGGRRTRPTREQDASGRGERSPHSLRELCHRRGRGCRAWRCGHRDSHRRTSHRDRQSRLERADRPDESDAAAERRRCGGPVQSRQCGGPRRVARRLCATGWRRPIVGRRVAGRAVAGGARTGRPDARGRSERCGGPALALGQCHPLHQTVRPSRRHNGGVAHRLGNGCRDRLSAAWPLHHRWWHRDPADAAPFRRHEHRSRSVPNGSRASRAIPACSASTRRARHSLSSGLRST